MNPKISELLARIQHIEAEIEHEMKRRRAELAADFDEKRVKFEQEVLAQQRRFKMGWVRYVLQADLMTALTAPVIYSVFFPMVVFDVFVTLYQHICFRVYRIPLVRRSDYFVFDRAHLAYLNWLEKFNCAYCSYGNGLMAYAREVVARTEQYWCPIKHARKVLAAHPHYAGFVDFGDAENYRQELDKLRQQIQALDTPPTHTPR